ncbi:hypothetical protein OPV22_026608 [Ensete ventricosum]|uniref:Retroviral polymerase SH3-like domain-containing protein n=1 Tax=Ensete ventricosum TaxID=4639 RepID=A0AAV8QKD6_ENSVE|nr:hypothetical protein OPV22_026608 [Ensete ventricosum]
MLRKAESAIKKEKLVLYIGETKKRRKANKTLKKGKGKGKESPSKAKVAKRDPAKDKGQCFHCGQDEHWKRNYKDYLVDKVTQKLREALGIFMIRLHLSDFYDNTWVLDTGSAYHICNSLQVLARPRRLVRDKMALKMGNGARVAAIAIGEVVKIWGCPAHVRRYNPNKLESRMEWCIFVGYPKETSGYYFYHPEDRKVFVSKRAVILEKEHILGGNSRSKIELSEVREPRTIPEPESVQVPNTQVPTLRRSSRVSHPPERYVGHINGDDSQDVDPQIYEEAIMSIDSGKWQEAMNCEMDSMYSNKV